MSDPKVAVIIPFRDTLKTLSRSVYSILNQSFHDIELILINDGSTDGSREMISNIKDARINIIDLPSSGSVAALNEGIYASKADFIALLDPYDIARMDRIQQQYNFIFKNDSIDVVASQVKYVQEHHDRNMKLYIEWSNSIITNQDLYLKRFINSSILHSTIMFRKKLIDNLGEFKYGKFPEDYELFLRWMENGVIFEKFREELTEWHDDLQRLSSRHTKYSSNGAMMLKTKYFASWYNSYFRKPPAILIWGVDSANQKKISFFESQNIIISGFIDDKYHSSIFDNKPVFKYDEVPKGVFIICFVEQFKPGIIPRMFSDKGLEEGLIICLLDSWNFNNMRYHQILIIDILTIGWNRPG